MCFFILRIVESESGGHRTPRFVYFDIELPCLHIFHPSHTVCAIAVVFPLCKALQKSIVRSIQFVDKSVVCTALHFTI